MDTTWDAGRRLRVRCLFMVAVLAFYLFVVPIHQYAQAQFAEAALGLAVVTNPYFLAFAALCVAGGYVYYDWTHDGPLHQWFEQSQAWSTLARAFMLGAFRQWVETPDAALDVSVPYSANLDGLAGTFGELLGPGWSMRTLGGLNYLSTEANPGVGVVGAVSAGWLDVQQRRWYPFRVEFTLTWQPSGYGQYVVSLLDPVGAVADSKTVLALSAGDSTTKLIAYDGGSEILHGSYSVLVTSILGGLPRRFEVRENVAVSYTPGSGSQVETYPVIALPPIDWDTLQGADVGLTVPGSWEDLVDVAHGDFPSYTAPFAVPVSTWPGIVVHPDTGVQPGSGTVVVDPPVVDTTGWDAWFAGLQGTLDWIAEWAATLAADLAARWLALNARLGTISANVASLAAQFGQFMVALPTLPAQIAAAGVNAWADFLQPENPLGPRVESLKTSALGRFPLGLIPLISGLAGTFFAAECGGHTFSMGVPASPWAIEVDLPTDPAWAVNTKALSRVAVAVMAVTYLIGLGRRFLGLGG